MLVPAPSAVKPPADAPAFDGLVGVDFTSRPTPRKPITLAFGRRVGAVLRLESLQAHADDAGFLEWLRASDGWLGAFDFPFGLPRELVQALGWPQDWPALMDRYAAMTREQIRETFAAFTAARPVGAKFAHRACDGPAGSSPSMKWVNPPVAFMLHAGVPLLRQAGIALPAVGEPGTARKVALEGYPGLLARELIGRRSYKADDAARRTEDRLIARKDLVDALEQGRSRLGLRLKLSHAQREALVDDASGDRLDAVLCLLQAGWAATQPDYGLPAQWDRLEGWITSA